MQKISFRDLPNTTTPINSDNLNLLQSNIEAAFKNAHSESENDTYNCKYLNNLIGGVLLKSISGPTSVSITSGNGYGVTTLFSTMYGAVIQFMGNNTIPNVIPIYGTPDFTTSVSGKTVTLSGIHEWDHYIFMGSSIIDEIV